MTARVGDKRRILVVDDDPSVCETVELLLKLEGHAVDTVQSGLEALALFAPDKFDLIFTDYYMPSMTGDKLAAAIKLRSPGQPVVMLTAYGEKLQASNCALTCIDAFIGKPFEIESLRQAVIRFASATT